MKSKTIYTSEFIEITRKDDSYYIQSFKKGMDIQEFNDLILTFNNISITSFVAIKDCLIKAPKRPEKFGCEKDRIVVTISNDEMEAYITLKINDSELENIESIINEIKSKLEFEGVVFGLKLDEIIESNSLVKNKSILVAIGKAPINGEDSIVKIKELNEFKPKEDTDVDGVNHFELNIITKVEKDEWLGEWTDPTEGIYGVNVKGYSVKPMPGLKIPIKYYKDSAKEEFHNGVTKVFALKSGGFVIDDENKLFISDMLEFPGDIDFNVGNINFDGSVSIKGTIKDSFSVIATNDIEILGHEGLGCIDKIVSKEGSIIIHGGISGKGKAHLSAFKDISAKYISETTIDCGGTLRVDSSILNSNVTARAVVIERVDGQLIGGDTTAITKIVSPKIGSISELITIINVTGISKSDINNQLQQHAKSIHEFKNLISKNAKQISIIENLKKPTQKDHNKLYKSRDEYYLAKGKIKELEAEVKSLTKELSLKGNGEVVASNKIFSKVTINMCGMQKVIYTACINSSFYFEDEEIKEK